MNVRGQIDVAAPPDRVWEQIADAGRYLYFMAGVTRWEPVGPRVALGPGSRVRVLTRIGPAELGGMIEIVEARAPAELAWVSITGIDQRGRWRLQPIGSGRTRVQLRLAYGIGGAGVFGAVAGRLAARTVRRDLRETLRQLKRAVEHEQTRAAAAQRRAAVTPG